MASGWGKIFIIHANPLSVEHTVQSHLMTKQTEQGVLCHRPASTTITAHLPGWSAVSRNHRYQWKVKFTISKRGPWSISHVQGLMTPQAQISSILARKKPLYLMRNYVQGVSTQPEQQLGQHSRSLSLFFTFQWIAAVEEGWKVTFYAVLAKRVIKLSFKLDTFV